MDNKKKNEELINWAISYKDGSLDERKKDHDEGIFWIKFIICPSWVGWFMLLYYRGLI